jgi:erythrin-vacuolar iron transport family protein
MRRDAGLIPTFRPATIVAVVVVIVELGVITWIRHRHMDTAPLTAAIQVGLGGALVFGAGVLLGNS